MTELDCDDLTSPGLRAILQEMGGGVVLGIVMAVQIATGDGRRQDLTIHDNQASMSTLLGLADILHRVMDTKAELSLLDLDETNG